MCSVCSMRLALLSFMLLLLHDRGQGRPFVPYVQKEEDGGSARRTRGEAPVAGGRIGAALGRGAKGSGPAVPRHLSARRGGILQTPAARRRAVPHQGGAR